MEKISDRIASGVVCLVIGIIIAFGLIFWVEWSALYMLGIIPPACAVAGFVAGEKAVEVFKEIASRI